MCVVFVCWLSFVKWFVSCLGWVNMPNRQIDNPTHWCTATTTTTNILIARTNRAVVYVNSFTGLSYDNLIKPLDPWNDLEDNYGKGAMKRFTNLKRINPDLKTLVAIGGEFIRLTD